MLKYLVDTGLQLIPAVLILGVILGYRFVLFGTKYKRHLTLSVVAGLLAAVVMGIMKNATSLVSTANWNLFIFSAGVIALILFAVFTGIGRNGKERALMLSVDMLGVIGALQLFYVIPDALSYPYQIYQTEKTILSTVFIYKLVGIILACVLCVVLCAAINMASRNIKRGLLFKLLFAVLAINAVKQVGSIISILLAKQMITSNHTLFMFAKFVTNYSDLFIYLTMIIIVVIPVVNWIRSRHIDEPYENNAQKRKIFARWRNIKRWSTTVIVCMIISIFDMTAVNAYVNQEVELSPIEDATQKDGAIYVPFEQVEDGHLHRFGYTTDNGVTIRFIIIKKPDSSSYGVGLDACDICGETGYYEKDGQVVCNKCDVVMNINTIGFKGGCNPIVIDYEVKDGNIIVPIDSLVEYEYEFE